MKGDIVVVRSGAYTGDSAMITKEWENSIAGFDMIFRPNENALPKYIATILLSQYILDYQLIPSRSRAAQPHLNAEELGSVVVALPELEEQLEIVNYLAHELIRIDEIKFTTEKTIALLEERRKTLISAVVTGQIEIP